MLSKKFCVLLFLQMFSPSLVNAQVEIGNGFSAALRGRIGDRPPVDIAASGAEEPSKWQERIKADRDVDVRILFRGKKYQPSMTSLTDSTGVRIKSRNDDLNELIVGSVSNEFFMELSHRDDIEAVEEVSPIFVDDLKLQFNIDARDSQQVEVFYQRYPTLRGQNLTAGIWDGGGVRASHDEFVISRSPSLVSRARQRDTVSSNDSHATHVAGTIAAQGVNRDAMGMAVEANLDCYDWNSDESEMVAAASRGVACTNHSYGKIRGWAWDRQDRVWRWWGDTSQSVSEDYRFGKYDGDSLGFDSVVANNPKLAVFVAAGNERNIPSLPSSQPVEHYALTNGRWQRYTQTTRNLDNFDNGYDTLEGTGVAKNVITIGAIEDITVDPPSPTDIRVTAFSSFGPPDDGRIKPDLVANGAGLLSTGHLLDNEYTDKSGTSMATPTSTGIGVLLTQLFEQEHGRRPFSDELKSILIHTAMHADNAPNYQTGWGSIRCDWASDLIEGTSGTVSRRVVAANDVVEVVGTVDSPTDIRVTVVWIDPVGRINTGGLDDRAKALVNNLDVTVVSPAGTTHYPWSLNPSSPTARATNNSLNERDNVERVDIPSENVTTGNWTIKVSAPAGIRGAEQKFAIAVTGIVVAGE